MKAWDEFLALQEKKVGRAAVDQWLRPLKVVRFDACNLYLEARDSFQALWFEEHIRHQVQQHLLSKNRRRIKVHLAINEEEARPAPAARREKKALESSPAFTLRFDQLDPNFTFENFLPSPNNELAYRLLATLCRFLPQTSAQIELGTFNPIYLHGGPGSGKSHLLMATARRLEAMGLRTLYVRAESFAEHVVGAIRAREMEQFRAEYRKCDALLIDDIQLLARKGATQEEFFHTFNTLHVEHKQLIISANSPPQELQSVEARLISRFEWGIVVPLLPLPSKLFEQLLAHRSAQLHLSLAPETAHWLLTAFSRNPKVLVQALEALTLRSHLDNRPIDLPIDRAMAERTLADLVQEERQTVATPQKIIDVVADYYGVSIGDILGKSQTREVSLPRKAAMFLCRSHLALPFKRIGEIFGRDHSTVISSIQQIQTAIEGGEEEVGAALSRIQKLL